MLFFPTVGCLIALIVHVAMKEDSVNGLQELIDTADWSILGNATVCTLLHIIIAVIHFACSFRCGIML